MELETLLSLHTERFSIPLSGINIASKNFVRLSRYLIKHHTKTCVFAYEYFVFLGKVTNPSAKPPFLEDQFVSLTACPAWEALPGT